MSIARHFAAAIMLAVLFGASTLALAQDDTGLVPDCGNAAAAKPGSPTYASIVCASEALMAQAEEIEARGNAVSARLPAAWRTAFDAQQQAFLEVAENCAATGGDTASCVRKAIAQRLRDIGDLAASTKGNLPTCAASDLSVENPGWGDAGMSQTTSVYLIEYTGKAACTLRGYPAVSVSDMKGNPQWTAVTYATSASYAELAGPPLPVTLSPESPTAWFTLSSASACDPGPAGSGYRVAIAPPLSSDVLSTVTLADANCGVTVTPIGMMSMVYASIR